VIDQYPSPNGVLTSLIWRKTMSGGETSLSGYDNASQALSYTPGQEQVYLNGILLVRGDDYTATNGTSITGLSALSASDFVQVNCYNNFSVASLPTSGLVGTISNAQLQNSAITINGTSVSLGGTYTVPGDIESVTAGTGLTGGGSSGAVTLSLSTPVSVANGGTGITSFGSGIATFLGTPSSSNLAAAVTDETGSGALVFGTSPTITTSVLNQPILISPEERMNIVASAATGTIALDSLTSGSWYYTSNATANWVLNVRGNSSTSLNSILTTGDSITIAFLATQGTTAYYQTSLQIDGTTSGVTVKWQGGTAPTSGNSSSIDAYLFNIIKTASATFTVLASQTKFA
jgi:hypothetical protein